MPAALCVLRRLSRLALEVLFFGTAIGTQDGSERRSLSALPGGFAPARDHPASVELDLAQLRPARIELRLVAVAGLGVVERDSADRAESEAVLPAQQRLRQGQDQGIVGPRADVEHVHLDI